MKVVCDGLDLADAVLKVIKATSSKTTNPILEGIKLVAEDDYLTLSATDLELSIEKKIKADIYIEGETVVPGKFFSEYIKKLTNEQIELQLNENNILSIKYTDSVGSIQCLNSEEFPNIKKLENNDYFEISAKNFKSLINKTVFSVAVDDSRPILKGVLFEVNENKIKGVALDGFRVALVKKELSAPSKEFNCIVPARSLTEISKFLEDTDENLKIYVQKNYLMVDVNETKIITRLLDGDFINYNQILPAAFTTQVIINKSQLEDALDRASLLSRVDKNNLVKFNIAEKLMKLSSKSDIGDIQEKLTISLNGNDLEIAFNARYFTEALRVIGDDFIKLNFTTSSAPCVITSSQTDEFIYLILPVRIV